jgi:pimeloyl-ACP methyl ester carboxylesterase
MRHGTLEPLQTESTVGGQIAELAGQIREYSGEPLVLLGHSWGAWLVYLLAARHPSIVKELLLVAAAVFDESYVSEMQRRRMLRMSGDERAEYAAIQERLAAGDPHEDTLLERLGFLAGRADDFCVDDTAENRDEMVAVSGEQYRRVWAEASEMRRSGELVKASEQIECPVRIIHGAEDPTPIEGVVEPLKGRVRDLAWYRLDRCGHTPWKERHARDGFLHIVESEIADARSVRHSNHEVRREEGVR